MEKLKELLNEPMKHISNVHECFEHCTNKEDVETVIKMIPHMFGNFYAEYTEGGFTITNTYTTTNEGPQIEITDYVFEEDV